MVGEYLDMLCVQLVVLFNGWYVCLFSSILYYIDVIFLVMFLGYCICDNVSELGFW